MGTRRSDRQPEVSVEGAHASTHGDRRLGSSVQVPVGIEALLYQAAQDAAFKRRLLADRQAAIRESHVELRPSERATLDAIPDAVLTVMIDRLVVANPRGRSVMTKVATAVATLAAGTAATTGCATDKEQPPQKPLTVETDPEPKFVTAGIDPATLIDGSVSDFDEPPIQNRPATSGKPTASSSSAPSVKPGRGDESKGR